MWKVTLALVAHRFFLLFIAFVSLNLNTPTERGPRSLPLIQSPSALWGRFLDRAGEGPEISQLQSLAGDSLAKVFTRTANPFLWASRIWMAISGVSALVTILLLSNLFLWLFLSELDALLNRMVTPDTASSAAILVILWPASYEMSLGATLSLTAYLVMLALRHSLDNQWFVTGVALGLLALLEPMVLGLLPLVLYLFWYFQRHFHWQQVLKRAAFLVVPSVLALFWRFSSYPSFYETLSGSAFFNLFSVRSFTGMSWTISKSYLGQTIALVFFGIGAVTGFLSNATMVHRLIPVTLWLLLVLFSPYGNLASRAPLAGVYMEGIASATSPPVERTIKLLLLGMGAYEVYTIFSIV